jgi:hypothetical protein
MHVGKQQTAARSRRVVVAEAGLPTHTINALSATTADDASRLMTPLLLLLLLRKLAHHAFPV